MTTASSALAAYSRFTAPSAAADERAAAFQQAAFRAVWPRLGAGLPDRERRLLNLRYGRTAGRALPMTVIAKLTRLPVADLRLIERVAFLRLKRPNLRRVLRMGESAA